MAEQNQTPKSQPKGDSPEHAPEAGEPTERNGSPARPSDANPSNPDAGKNEHWESGRQKAVE